MSTKRRPGVFLLLPVLLLTLAFLAGGCPRQQVYDYSSLVSDLRDLGATVEERMHQAESGLFPGALRRNIIIGGGNIQVYEYETPEAMEEFAGYISGSGSQIKRDNVVTMIDWIDYPHFYMSGQIIVIYVGRDPEIIDLLERLLGKQFAGA